MARFCGEVGYGESVETAPGVYRDVVIEQLYYGDVLTNTRRMEDSSDSVNSNLSISNSISILADEYANNHFFAIRYVRWSGVCWSVSSVRVASPRLILQLGDVYNGPKGTAPVSP